MNILVGRPVFQPVIEYIHKYLTHQFRAHCNFVLGIRVIKFDIHAIYSCRDLKKLQCLNYYLGKHADRVQPRRFQRLFARCLEKIV